MDFRQDFTRSNLVKTLIGLSFWSGFNVLCLNLIYYFDHEFIGSETLLACFMIPVGLINCAVLIYGFKALRTFYWKTLLVAVISCLNFSYFLFIWQSLHQLSGSMAN
ncbi:MAG: hypothetical protein QE487_04790 [Fluviicola sp.]|nr:hypothetical protein [Fluviicola sp.]